MIIWSLRGSGYLYPQAFDADCCDILESQRCISVILYSLELANSGFYACLESHDSLNRDVNTRSHAEKDTLFKCEHSGSGYLYPQALVNDWCNILESQRCISVILCSLELAYAGFTLVWNPTTLWTEMSIQGHMPWIQGHMLYKIHCLNVNTVGLGTCIHKPSMLTAAIFWNPGSHSVIL